MKSSLPIRLFRHALFGILPLFVTFCWSSGCKGGGDSGGISEGISAFFSTLPATAPTPEGNPSVAERVDLGRMLFFEPRLSRSNTISCNTCHSVGAAGVDNQALAIGEGERLISRNSPTVFNAAFLETQFWDGRVRTLEEQAKDRIQAHGEMNLSPEEAIQRLLETGYEPYFEAAFPDEEVPLTFDNIAKALAAFERTLLTPGSAFDRYLEGDMDALTEDQKGGLAIFQAEGCAGCHNGPLLGGEGYTAFTHVAGSEDVGRAAVTNRPEDTYTFRIAPLRNVALTHPYFHNGSAKTLKDAVSVMGEAQLRTRLPEVDQEKLVAFLESLTGEFPQIPAPILPRRMP